MKIRLWNIPYWTKNGCRRGQKSVWWHVEYSPSVRLAGGKAAGSQVAEINTATKHNPPLHPGPSWTILQESEKIWFYFNRMIMAEIQYCNQKIQSSPHPQCSCHWMPHFLTIIDKMALHWKFRKGTIMILYHFIYFLNFQCNVIFSVLTLSLPLSID